MKKIYHKQIEAYFSLGTERLISVLVNKANPIAMDIQHFQGITSSENSITTSLLYRLMNREPMFNTITLQT